MKLFLQRLATHSVETTSTQWASLTNWTPRRGQSISFEEKEDNLDTAVKPNPFKLDSKLAKKVQYTKLFAVKLEWLN